MKTQTMNKASFNKWMKNNEACQYVASGTSDGFLNSVFFVNDKIESDIIIVNHYKKPIAYIIKSLDELKNNIELQKSIFRIVGLNYIFDGNGKMVCSIYRKKKKQFPKKFITNIERCIMKTIYLKNNRKILMTI